MTSIRTASALACAAVALISACSSRDDEAKQAAEQAIKERLTDPYSAHFSDEFVVRKKVDDKFFATSVCGSVNSKNPFGGYSGKSRFIAGTADISPEKKGQFVYLETNTMRGAAASSHVPKPSLYEEIYWNRYCVDSEHPATFTGE